LVEMVPFSRHISVGSSYSKIGERRELENELPMIVRKQNYINSWQIMQINCRICLPDSRDSRTKVDMVAGMEEIRLLMLVNQFEHILEEVTEY
jgi:hypothetical protein